MRAHDLGLAPLPARYYDGRTGRAVAAELSYQGLERAFLAWATGGDS